jgi:hypothetical protein
MFFKTPSPLSIVGVSLVLMALIFLGCAGENDVYFQSKDVAFQSPQFNCLATFDETVIKFIDGNLNDGEVSEFWDCLDTAVVAFVSYVRGKDGTNYTPEELAGFVDRYFLGQRGLAQNSALLAELMQLKRIFIGGPLDRITALDLSQRTRAFIKSGRQIMLDLNPHMGVIAEGLTTSAIKNHFTNDQITGAATALKKAGTQVAVLIQHGNHFYSFGHILALLKALEKFVQTKFPDFALDEAKKFMPILGEIKGLLVSQPNDLILSGDWVRLIDVMTSVLGWTLEYRHYIEDQEWAAGPGLLALERIVQGGLGQLEMGLLNQPNHVFTFLNLNRVIDLLSDIMDLPLNLRAATVKDVLYRFGTRLLQPDGNVGLDTKDMAILRLEAERWMQGQRYINRYLRGDLSVLDGGSREMSELMSGPLRLTSDNSGRLHFSHGFANRPYDLSTLSNLNWQRALVRPFLRNYTKQSSPDGAASLNSDELLAGVREWQVLASDLGLYEPSEAETRAKRIMIEANLFLPSSQGDDNFSFAEATHYLAFVISGLANGTAIRDELVSECGHSGAPKTLDPECFRQKMKGTEKARYFSQFPVIVSELGGGGGPSVVWGKFVHLMEAAVRDPNRLDQPVTRSNIVESMILLHYIETFFARFDLGNDQRANVGETLRAYPLYRKTLLDLVKKMYGITLGEEDLEALFTFFFKYGSPPEANFGGMVKLLNWKWTRSSWSYEADRMRVIEILSQLNNMVTRQ